MQPTLQSIRLGAAVFPGDKAYAGRIPRGFMQSPCHGLGWSRGLESTCNRVLIDIIIYGTTALFVSYSCKSTPLLSILTSSDVRAWFGQCRGSCDVDAAPLVPHQLRATPPHLIISPSSSLLTIHAEASAVDVAATGMYRLCRDGRRLLIRYSLLCHSCIKIEVKNTPSALLMARKA